MPQALKAFPFSTGSLRNLKIVNPRTIECTTKRCKLILVGSVAFNEVKIKERKF